MKTYLNSRQKDDFIRLAAMQTAAEDIKTEWQEHDFLTKDEHKNLKTVITLTQKFLTSVVSRLAPEEGMHLLRRAKGTKVVCMPTESESAFRKRMEQELNNEYIYIHREALDTIIEMVLCKGCKPCQAEDKLKCPLRAAMIELDVPKYDSQPAENSCPWEIIYAED